MGLTEENYKQTLLKELHVNNAIDYSDLLKIADAFQIASGQSFAIGKTKALLDFIIRNNLITIKNVGNTGIDKPIASVKELAIIFKNIDQFIDLENERDFKQYFHC